MLPPAFTTQPSLLSFMEQWRKKKKWAINQSNQRHSVRCNENILEFLSFSFWEKTKVLFQVCSPAYPAIRFVLQTVVLVEVQEQSLLELRCWQGNILYKWFFAGRFSSVPSFLPRENAMRPWTWKWKKDGIFHNTSWSQYSLGSGEKWS